MRWVAVLIAALVAIGLEWYAFAIIACPEGLFMDNCVWLP